MGALAAIGALLTYGGAVGALWCYQELRKRYGQPWSRTAHELNLLLLMYFLTFVSAIGGALLVTNTVEELEWHRTIIAFGVSAAIDHVTTGLIMFGPKPKEVTKLAPKDTKLPHA